MISVLSSAVEGSVSAAGQTVHYTFLVTNTGNVTLTGAGVTNTMSAPAGALDAAPVCPATTLAPGDSTTCTATYTTTQADIDDGAIGQSATASGTPPSGPGTVSSASSTTVSAIQSPAVTVVSSSGTVSVSSAGQRVDYRYLVANTGNVTLTGVAVTSAMDAPAGALDAAPVCPVTTLAPGASTTCTATYTVTQADVDAGRIVNHATASATTPNHTTVSSPASSATVTVKGALAQLQDLLALVGALPSSTARTVLGVQLGDAIAAEQGGNTSRVCLDLFGVVRAAEQEESYGQLTAAQSTSIVNAANQIAAVVGCGGVDPPPVLLRPVVKPAVRHSGHKRHHRGRVQT